MDIRLSQLLRVLPAIILLPILHLSQTTIGLAQVKTSIDTELLIPQRLSQLAEKANQLDQKGDYAAAAGIWEKIINYVESELGHEHPYTATSLHNLAFLYEKQGLYDKAEQLYLRSLEIREKVLGPEHLHVATTLSNLGDLYSSYNLYTKAEPLLQRALAIREKVLGPEHVDVANTLNNLGLLHLRQELYAKAEPIFSRSVEIIEKALGAESLYLSIPLANLAAVYDGQGLLSKAESLHLRSFKIQVEALGPEHPDLATTLNNLGYIYQRLGQYGHTEKLYRRALEISLKAFGVDHPNTIKFVNNIGLLYEVQELYDKAEPLYQRALAISEKILGAEHVETARSLNNLANSYNRQGLYDQAEPLYQRALDINEKTYGVASYRTIVALSNLSDIYAKKGMYREAHLLLRRGIVSQTIRIQREAPAMVRQDRQGFLNMPGNTYETIFDQAKHGRSGAELALFTRLNRQGLLEEIEKRQAQLAVLPGEQQEVAMQLRAVTQQLSSLSLSSEQREPLREQQEKLERELYHLLPELKPRVVEVSDVAAVLPQNGALIEFQRYEAYDARKKDGKRREDARYLALMLNEDRSIEAIDLGLADRIDRQVEKALIASEQDLADAEALWAEVGELVMRPLTKTLAGVDTLVISPDGELNRLPFAALPAPSGGGLLAERYRLRLVTTGRELLDLKRPQGSRGKTPLVVANPDFDLVLGGSRKSSGPAIASGTAQKEDEKESVLSERIQQRSAEIDQLVWGPLPGTKEEGEFVAGLLDGRLLVQQNARAEAVQQAKAPVVLHIASHAFFLPDQEQENQEGSGDDAMRAGLQGNRGLKASVLAGESPLLRSGIALAGANRVSQREEGEEGDDGYLTALEVAQLDWKGTELVVISACESGKGDIRAGEGVYGLKRAIAVSGARSSLLSLWKVDDQATAAFMRSFYEKLKAGDGRAEALANAQKEFRNHPKPMWRSPYVWAAFQLSGDWGPIKGL